VLLVTVKSKVATSVGKSNDLAEFKPKFILDCIIMFHLETIWALLILKCRKQLYLIHSCPFLFYSIHVDRNVKVQICFHPHVCIGAVCVYVYSQVHTYLRHFLSSTGYFIANSPCNVCSGDDCMCVCVCVCIEFR
jgi:hypothetical protein